MLQLEHCVDKDTPFAIGSKLSLADLTIYNFLSDFFDDKERALKSIEKCEGITKAVASAKTALASYLAARVETPF